jgi:hypothetical protein
MFSYTAAVCGHIWQSIQPVGFFLSTDDLASLAEPQWLDGPLRVVNIYKDSRRDCLCWTNSSAKEEVVLPFPDRSQWVLPNMPPICAKSWPETSLGEWQRKRQDCAEDNDCHTSRKL